MFEKLAIYVCLAGIVVARNKHNAVQNAPTLTASSSSTSQGVSTDQYPIPVEARILQYPQTGQYYVNSPTLYTTRDNVAQYPSNAGAYEYFARPSSTFTIKPNAVQITSASVVQNPVLVQQPNQYNQDIAERSAVQYITRPAAGTVLVKENPAQNLVLNSQKSVTVPPPSKIDTSSKYPVQFDANHAAVQYVAAPAVYPVSPYVFDASQGYYAKANPQTNNPVAVPVVYNAEEAIKPQYIIVANPAQSAPVIAYKAPVPIPQPVAVPAAYSQNQGTIRYKVPTPIVYSKPTNDSPTGLLRVATRPIPYSGYSRALKYSPAPAVSKVSFNGLGVTYGW